MSPQGDLNAEEPPPTTLSHGDRAVRLKWHQLRQRPSDPPFSRANLRAGLAAGASLEVDLRCLACGRFVCLHDARLEGETTGEGPVAGIDGDAIARLQMRDAPGERPILLDELADAVRAGPCAPDALVQLDLKDAEIENASRVIFAEILDDVAGHFILSGCDWEAVRCLGGAVRGLALGYDPTTMPATTRPRQGARSAREPPTPIPSTCIASWCAPRTSKAIRWSRGCAQRAIGSTAGRSITARPRRSPTSASRSPQAATRSPPIPPLPGPPRRCSGTLVAAAGGR